MARSNMCRLWLHRTLSRMALAPACQPRDAVAQPTPDWMCRCPVMPDHGHVESGNLNWRLQNLQMAWPLANDSARQQRDHLRARDDFRNHEKSGRGENDAAWTSFGS